MINDCKFESGLYFKFQETLKLLPKQRKGSAACMGVYGKSRRDATATEMAKPLKTLTIPAMER